MLAVIASGHADAADLFLLVAFVLAAVACVFAVTKAAVESALLSGALAFVALGLLVL